MDMDILSWNCRGICNTTTTRALKDLIAQNRPQIIFLCETKISNIQDFQDLHRALGFPHSKEVLSEGQARGLGLFWTDEVDLQVRTSSSHHIDAEVRGNPGEPRWRLTGFYGYARTHERDRSWQLLRDLSDLDSLPWVIIGDFNEILNSEEKINGPVRSENQMRGFRDALGYGDLLDLGFTGTKSTWWNSDTQLRLDRAVCTPAWCDIYGYAKVTHLPPSDSDHIPILLQASTIPIAKRPKHHRFKFEAFWLQHSECDPLVQEVWRTDVVGIPMFKAIEKISLTRVALDKWQKQTFRVRQQQMLGIRARLEELMEMANVDLVQEEKKCLMDRLHSLLSQEEIFWKQRSKITWLKEGDRNTGFFHRKASNRKRKNAIQGLYDADGNWRDDDIGMEHIVASYFQTMYTASELDMEAMETTLQAIKPCVTREMNDHLCAQYSSEEVRCALFQMYPTKSPGPDGMPPLFFQHYWETIGGDITEAVKCFLHSGHLLKQINFTHICLIPKVSNPENMSDLRPIALCNVIYKICSKVIANRLKVILPSIISPFQSAFVPGRLITDNILVANEVAHFVHNKREGHEGFMALKLDLSKAYDRMEWAFLRKVLDRFGFAQVWCDMVMQCVTTVRYSFLVRGKPRSLVIPSRGLRQGDPLSPYLFLLGAEGFSALLQRKQEAGLLSGIEVCQEAPSVNHLLFADDSMLYAQASFEECYQIQEVIETYGRASGQLVNFNKSSVVFSKNVSAYMQEEISNYLGVEIVASHEKYLGLPTYVGRKKTATFQYIKDNLAKKLQHWQGKLLSGAGKDILIRVVAQALPTYAMSVFQLTKNFCEDLEQMCARFWWGSTLDKRKIHWKSWDFLCNPKEEGGLGFRSLSEFNSAMLAKQAWRVVNNPDSLIARMYKARYFPEHSFWSAVPHSSPSYSWRSIFSTRDLLSQGSYWQIGDGRNVSVWCDPWIPGLASFKPTSGTSVVDTDLKVSHFISSPGVWNANEVHNNFSTGEAEAILAIPLSVRALDDRLAWRLEGNGKFSVKTAYHFAYSHSLSRIPILLPIVSNFWKKLWNRLVPNSTKVHIWKICHNILPSLDRIASKGVELESMVCVLCDNEMETTVHLCRDCLFTKQVLQPNASFTQVCYSDAALSLDVVNWLDYCMKNLSSQSFGELIYLLWGVWKERNNRVWDNKRGLASDVIFRSMSGLADFRFHNTKTDCDRNARVQKWSCPPIGCIKINFDGSFNPSSRKGGIGFVARDFEGKMLAGGRRPVDNLLSPEHAEVLACRMAFDYIEESSCFPVIVETDALVLQRQLTATTEPNCSILGRIYDDLVEFLSTSGTVKIAHVNRSANNAAHLMAAYASSASQEVRFFSTPSFLSAAIAAELSTM